MDPHDPDAIARAIRVKDAARERLLAIPGVHGVGVGFRWREGRRTDELALVVLLREKRPLKEIPPDQVIPPEIDGLQTDVQEAGLPEYAADTARYRPLRGGSKLQWTLVTVTHPAPNTTSTSRQSRDGTLGCMARSRRNGKTMLLTNAHVVSGCDPPETAIGRRIGQPNDDSDHTCCSKSWATVVGTVVDAKSHPANRDVDVALIELDKCVDVQPQVVGLGPIHGVLNTTQLNGLMNQPVRWRGFRTEEVRQGVVAIPDVDSSIVCRADDDSSSSVIHSFTDCIGVQSVPPGTALSQRGDSGSVVLDLAGNVVGLLFGHGPVMGVDTVFVCRIDRILSVFQARWDLEILTNPGTGPPNSAAPAPALPLGAARPAAAPETFTPAADELALLERARDELLTTPGGSRLLGVVTPYVDEIRELIQTQRRVAAVWHRVATPELPRAALAALRDPERPLPGLVEGAPLPERIARLRRVLARYGSEALQADLARFTPHVLALSAGSYAQARAWLQAPPPDV